MKLNAVRIAFAMALCVAALWLSCSLLVWLFPAAMLSVSSYMMHIDLTGTSWVVSPGGVFIGLVVWTLVAGLSGFVVASVYNRIG